MSLIAWIFGTPKFTLKMTVIVILRPFGLVYFKRIVKKVPLTVIVKIVVVDGFYQMHVMENVWGMKK